MKKGQKNTDPRRLFKERMIREGRLDEWQATINRLKNETGRALLACTYDAMREMGFISPENERLLATEFHNKEFKNNQADRFRDQAKLMKWELKVKVLPDKAPVATEMDWIRSHPAMLRRARTNGNLEDILLTEEDIENAPSRAAVTALQHWVNCPKDFYKSILSEQKKAKDEGVTGGMERDIGLDEVRRLLKSVQSRRKDGD